MAKQKTIGVRAALSRQMRGANFGDERLSERLSTLVDRVVKSPELSFPKVSETEAELEGAYRFLRNERVSMERILRPHLEATHRRMSEEECLCIHDTTNFDFSWHEDITGMGKLPGNKQGFFGHFAFAVNHAGAPLGVAGLETIFRYENLKDTRAERPTADKESYKWARMVEEVEGKVGAASKIIHVADREADGYAFLSEMIQKNRKFVIRMGRKRYLQDGQLLTAAVSEFEGLAEREVWLSKREPALERTKLVRKPGRKRRIAQLSISSGKAQLVRPSYVEKHFLETLTVNIVRVFEPNPPEAEAPVEWILATTEEVSTREQALRAVDIYRKRWMVEEFFKALKTGCAYEERQLESRTTLLNALGVFVPVAFTLLLLRTLSRQNPALPATTVLTQNQIQLLTAISQRVKLTANPTVRQALLAVAGLGGHIKNNGDPGWIVIGRGYSDLMLSEIGWNAANRLAQNKSDTISSTKRCDQ